MNSSRKKLIREISALIFLPGRKSQLSITAIASRSINLGCTLGKMLFFPENYSVEVIPSGCCGMAGSFGYEKEHYYLSMKIGKFVLLPAVRNGAPGSIIAAHCTSYRYQVKDRTGVKAKHPLEIL
ncbi:MAG: hypothetical protein ABIO77_02745 [Ginsengibacter sp.]